MYLNHLFKWLRAFSHAKDAALLPLTETLMMINGLGCKGRKDVSEQQNGFME